MSNPDNHWILSSVKAFWSVVTARHYFSNHHKTYNPKWCCITKNRIICFKRKNYWYNQQYNCRIPQLITVLFYELHRDFLLRIWSVKHLNDLFFGESRIQDALYGRLGQTRTDTTITVTVSNTAGYTNSPTSPLKTGSGKLESNQLFQGYEPCV